MYNEKIANRTLEIITRTHKNVEQKKMFGGVCFMVNGKMCVGVEQERIMVRLDPEVYEKALEQEGCTPMDFTGKVMKGYVFVENRVLSSPKMLNHWIQLALDFNQRAKASKKKKKK
jgi:TfoX/Sxy family transcriptional regulator of competence genes